MHVDKPHSTEVDIAQITDETIRPVLEHKVT